MNLTPVTCTKCNTVNRPRAIYCHECGQKFIVVSKPPLNPPHRNKKRLSQNQITIIGVLSVILFLILVVAVSIIAYWFASGGSFSGLLK